MTADNRHRYQCDDAVELLLLQNWSESQIFESFRMCNANYFTITLFAVAKLFYHSLIFEIPPSTTLDWVISFGREYVSWIFQEHDFLHFTSSSIWIVFYFIFLLHFFVYYSRMQNLIYWFLLYQLIAAGPQMICRSELLCVAKFLFFTLEIKFRATCIPLRSYQLVSSSRILDKFSVCKKLMEIVWDIGYNLNPFPCDKCRVLSSGSKFVLHF